MSDTLEGARQMIEARLAEIDVEATKLRSALASLGGSVATARPRATPKRRREKGRKRAPRGQRQAQFLAAVEAKPGSTAAELGKAISVSTNQAYALGQRALKAGEVKKSGKGFKAAK